MKLINQNNNKVINKLKLKVLIFNNKFRKNIIMIIIKSYKLWTKLG